MSSYDDETFVKAWEGAERSRHARLLQELRHEYRTSLRASASVRSATDSTDSLRVPSAPHQQVEPQSRLSIQVKK